VPYNVAERLSDEQLAVKRYTNKAYFTFSFTNPFSALTIMDGYQKAKEKGKEEYLYIAVYTMQSESAQTWITHFTCKLHHACLSFVSIHQMEPPLR